MKIRVQYEKLPPLSFISHLDVQKTFHRAFRRSNINLVHSNGFHPHPKMSYAPPLPLFCASLDEYMDAQIKENLNKDEIKERLNASLPEKLQITNVTILDEEAKNLSRSLESARYEIKLISSSLTKEEEKKLIEIFLEKEELLVIKKSKKSEKEVDLKILMSDTEIDFKDKSLLVKFTLPLSDEEIISPTLVSNVIKESLNNVTDLLITTTKLKTNLKKS